MMILTSRSPDYCNTTERLDTSKSTAVEKRKDWAVQRDEKEAHG